MSVLCQSNIQLLWHALKDWFHVLFSTSIQTHWESKRETSRFKSCPKNIGNERFSGQRSLPKIGDKKLKEVERRKSEIPINPSPRLEIADGRILVSGKGNKSKTNLYKRGMALPTPQKEPHGSSHHSTNPTPTISRPLFGPWRRTKYQDTSDIVCRA